MSIKETKEKYAKGVINKGQFIDAMYQYHNILFEYANELKNTEIEKIELTDGKILLTSRKTADHAGGLQFIVDIQDKRNVPLETFNFNYYEREDSEMIFKMITPDSHVFDIGANIGWYTIHISDMLKGGSIHCFEPIPATYKKLTDNINLNNIKSITTNNIALSEKKQILTFYFDPNQSGSSSSKNITENENIEKLELNSITLDDYMAQNKISKIDFIKCDVEGAELFVFQGATETLKKHTPIVFTELLRKWAAKFGYHPNEIMQIFHAMDYQAFYTKNEKLNLIELVDENTVNTNFFFLHKEKHKQLISELCQKG